MITAYDYPSALACSSSSLTDITLVGDSLAQVCMGYSSTTQLTHSEMIHHAKAVARGSSHPLLVADMPFGTYHVSIAQAIANAVEIIREGRMEAVKLEGGKEIADTVHRLTEVGIPVMAHVGLLPQRHTSLSGYKVQGRTMDGGKKVLQDALALQEAGAFALVIEAVPLELGKYITGRLKIPTIGIGAGPHTSGQVCHPPGYSYLHLLHFTGSCLRRYYGCMVWTQGEIRSTLCELERTTRESHSKFWGSSEGQIVP
jgi:3-methyl-2-oxobutanoate hydroxymethyltransferase